MSNNGKDAGIVQESERKYGRMGEGSVTMHNGDPTRSVMSSPGSYLDFQGPRKEMQELLNKVFT